MRWMMPTVGCLDIIKWDSRDNINSASKGSYASWLSRIYTSVLGSDYEFLDHELDLRHYFSLPGERVIAIRTLQQITHGDVPFLSLATTDGVHELRGAQEGKYQDRQSSSFQIEYRGTPLPWRFGYRVFAETSQVRSNFDELQSAKFQKSFGFGIRWALNPERKYNVRLDIPWVEGNLSPVIEITEAF